MHRLLSSDGCTLRYSVNINEKGSYVVVSLYSENNMQFLNDPIMMIRTFEGDVLKFEGEKNDNSIVVDGYANSSGGYVSSTSISTAQFHINPQEFELFKSGIKKIRLSTYPYEHEREFKKDKIGKPLYELYVEAATSYDDF